MTTTPTSTAATATVDYVVEVYDPDSPEDVYRRELVTDMPEEHRTATGEHFARKYPACGVRLIRVTTEPLATF